jgi:hypothetical protein
MEEAPEPAGCGRKLLLVAGGEGRMESSPVVGRGACCSSPVENGGGQQNGEGKKKLARGKGQQY